MISTFWDIESRLPIARDPDAKNYTILQKIKLQNLLNFLSKNLKNEKMTIEKKAAGIENKK